MQGTYIYFITIIEYCYDLGDFFLLTFILPNFLRHLISFYFRFFLLVPIVLIFLCLNWHLCTLL